MSTELWIGLLSLFGTLAGTFSGIVVSSKLSNYRIEQLEKKMDKHNTVIERMAIAETKLTEMNHRIKDLESA